MNNRWLNVKRGGAEGLALPSNRIRGRRERHKLGL